MTGPALAEQTVDWATQTAEWRRLYWRHVWQERRHSQIIAGIIWLLALVQRFAFGENWLLCAALFVTALLLFGAWERYRQFSQIAQQAGVTHYRAEADALHIVHRLGDFRLPYQEFQRQYSYPEGIIVYYAFNAAFSLLNGPVQGFLIARKRP